MADTLTRTERSKLMSRVRGRGNQSTELAVAVLLRRHRVSGWRRHLSSIPGRPDFLFAKERVAVFVDGCFWHGCPICGRLPKTRRAFWTSKIARNKRRDRAVSRALATAGYSVIRIWEHEIAGLRWLAKLKRALKKMAYRTNLRALSGAPSSILNVLPQSEENRRAR